ncbi:hypothetical protein SDC9_183047 [bioreactor metagenome]|uniref:Uncharacterized protein n=1 Tax=bioreactor metagenome TaxID=1076179 RepID=A0A645HBP5_9ZZZZ
MAAGLGGTGEIDEIDPRVSRQIVADLRAFAGNGIQDSIRQTGLTEHFSQTQGADGPLRRRLHDAGIASDQSGSNLGYRQVDRVIERGDGQYRTDGRSRDNGQFVHGSAGEFVAGDGFTLNVLTGVGGKADKFR